MMKRLTDKDPETESADLPIENIRALKALFPGIVTECPDGAAVDMDALRELVADRAVTGGDESFGLVWHGKHRARRLAFTPSTGTLRPCPEESVDWETTENLMIEGDNLEVLKLLQKRYSGKVKLIYIDPPYNTGEDFVYRDNYRDTIRGYLAAAGLSDTGASGRFHTTWLNMMYPRLILARLLLREDGLFVASIDDNEVNNLRSLCDQVFGEENYLQQLVWKRHAGGGNDARHFAVDHEYLLVYAKSRDAVARLRMPLSDAERAGYTLKDRHVGTLGPYKLKSFRRMRPDDPRPNLTYAIRTPDGGVVRDTWKWEESRFLRALAEDKVQMRQDRAGRWHVEYKIYLRDPENGEERTRVPRSLLLDVERNADGKRQLRSILGWDNVFTNPKPVGLIRHVLSFGTGAGDIVLDFFAGSGTTGHAVLEQNAVDGGGRRYILVQMPEPLDTGSRNQKSAAGFCDAIGRPRTIAEITKERLRRAAEGIRRDHPAGDVGFRVYRLDAGNLRAREAGATDPA